MPPAQVQALRRRLRPTAIAHQLVMYTDRGAPRVIDTQWRPWLVSDAPTTGLDVLVARAVLQNIERLRGLGKCILFSSHIMREVEKLCDRVAIISKGQIRTCGTLAELRVKHGQEDLEELFFSLVS